MIYYNIIVQMKKTGFATEHLEREVVLRLFRMQTLLGRQKVSEHGGTLVLESLSKEEETEENRAKELSD